MHIATHVHVHVHAHVLDIPMHMYVCTYTYLYINWLYGSRTEFAHVHTCRHTYGHTHMFYIIATRACLNIHICTRVLQDLNPPLEGQSGLRRRAADDRSQGCSPIWFLSRSGSRIYKQIQSSIGFIALVALIWARVPFNTK